MLIHKTILLIVIMLLSFAEYMSASEMPQADSDFEAVLRSGVRAGIGRVLPYVDYLLPIQKREDALLFLDYKSVKGNRGDAEQNLGLGGRALLGKDEQMIVGANFYYDNRYTENNNFVHQLGFGFETISQWVDARANFYFPLSDKQSIDRSTTFLFSGTSVIRSESETFEEPLTGFDYEGGVLVPWISKWFETRAYLGGYHYQSHLSEDINGIRARLEVRPSRLLTIELEVKEDNQIDADFFIGGYINLPFEIGSLWKSYNPFKGFKKHVGFAQGPRTIRQRMTQMVIRDIDIVASVSDPIIKSAVPVVSNILFVDNQSAAGGDGSFSRPFNTLAGAIASARYVAGSTIYVAEGDGTATGYTGNFVMVDNTTIWGQGFQKFQGLGGGGFPLIDGGGAGDVVRAGTGVEITGLTIQNGNSGIFSSNESNVYVHHNTIISNTLSGLRVISDDGLTKSGFTITNNSFTSNTSEGLRLSSLAAGTVLDNITISGNTFKNTGAGAINRVETTGTLSNVTYVNNTFNSNGSRAINHFADNGTMTGFLYRDNIVTNNTTVGIDFASINNGSTVSDFTFTNNTISGNTTRGFQILNNSGAATIQDFTFTRNTITGNGVVGVSLQRNATATFTNINFGNSSTGVGGFNSIFNNTGLEFRNESGTNGIMAENNFWTGGGVCGAECGGTNTSDSDPFLTENPN